MAYFLASKHSARWFTWLCLIQGIYYLVTGIWPLIDLNSFEMVTGPKHDHWLVQTVGVLIAVVAVVLLVAAWRRRVSATAAVLAIGSAVALAGVDIVFVSRGIIPPIYLGDAVLEVLLLIGWAIALYQPVGFAIQRR